MTQEITGHAQLNWMMDRFNKTKEEAIKLMIEHNQDMSFLVENKGEIECSKTINQ